MVAEQPAQAIAAAVIQPLREVLDVPRAIVNRFDLAAGEVEWVAAAGRRRTHAGPGVRYSLALMGDADALHRGEPQMIDVRALPPGPDAAALLGSGVYYYLVVPMIAGGELLGALSFGGASREFRTEQVNLAQEVATQLAIATMQTRLLERVKGQALELEAKVRERTAELESANQDLSSFSYSVSHDLRSPLRAVDGYARMLEEDYASKLDDEGRRLLGVVRDSSRQMGQLIDDLLAFSRLGRQAVVKQSLDMTALAREVIDELRSGSAAHVALAALPAAHADRALIKQVWINLVGNALKYSAKRVAPHIEIGAREEAAENVYWVRDNGAGFDMRYAGKLFGVFQRLHRSDEFEGTGVGLAIVQRVVARHGGRVWAEGRPDEGACFSFCLPR
jgi:signal transduction histidine kinase